MHARVRTTTWLTPSMVRVVRAIRGHLLGERGLSRSDMSCSPYWRRAMTDEAWRQVKGDFVAAMDADVA